MVANIVHIQFQRTYDLAAQLLSLGEQQQDSVLIVEGRYGLGMSLFYQGDFELSRVHLEQAIAHYDPQYSRVHIASYTQDPKVVCLIRLAFDLWCLGYPDQAEARRREALALARALSHPFSMGYCLAFDAILQSIQRDIHATREQAEAVIVLGREHRLGQWLPMGLALHGWAIANQGATEAGIANLQEGIVAFQAAGSQHLRPYFLALLADLHAKAGNVERSLSVLSEALAAVERSEERWYEAELHRCVGELLLLLGEEGDAEAALERALKIARTQKTRSFELRASKRLAELWQKRGKRAEAHQLLSPNYSWFTEGFETADLMDSKVLLDAIEH
jgi:predicted ATPase